MRTIVFFAVIAVLAVAISARPSVQRYEKSMATDSPERDKIDSNKINKVAMPNSDKSGTNREVKREKIGFFSHLKEQIHTYRSHVADRAANAKSSFITHVKMRKEQLRIMEQEQKLRDQVYIHAKELELDKETEPPPFSIEESYEIFSPSLSPEQYHFETKRPNQFPTRPSRYSLGPEQHNNPYLLLPPQDPNSLYRPRDPKPLPPLLIPPLGKQTHSILPPSVADVQEPGSVPDLNTLPMIPSDNLTPSTLEQETPSPSEQEATQNDIQPSQQNNVIPTEQVSQENNLTPSPSEQEPTQNDITPSPSEQQSQENELTPPPSEQEPTQNDIASSPSEQESQENELTPSSSEQESTQNYIAPSPSEQESQDNELTPSPSEQEPTQNDIEEPTQNDIASSPPEQEPTQNDIATSLSEQESLDSNPTPSPSEQEPTQNDIEPSLSEQETQQNNITPSPSEQEPTQNDVAFSPSEEESSENNLTPSEQDSQEDNLTQSPSEQEPTQNNQESSEQQSQTSFQQQTLQPEQQQNNVSPSVSEQDQMQTNPSSSSEQEPQQNNIALLPSKREYPRNNLVLSTLELEDTIQPQTIQLKSPSKLINLQAESSEESSNESEDELRSYQTKWRLAYYLIKEQLIQTYKYFKQLPTTFVSDATLGKIQRDGP